MRGLWCWLNLRASSCGTVGSMLSAVLPERVLGTRPELAGFISE